MSEVAIAKSPIVDEVTENSAQLQPLSLITVV